MSLSIGRRRTAEQWRSLIAEQVESGLSRALFFTFLHLGFRDRGQVADSRWGGPVFCRRTHEVMG